MALMNDHVTKKKTGNALTDGIHGMRRKLEHAVKDECTTLEEAVAPVPTVILDHIVRFRLDPEVKCNEDNTTDPAAMR
jgi:hypothetical protein